MSLKILFADDLLSTHLQCSVVCGLLGHLQVYIYHLLALDLVFGMSASVPSSLKNSCWKGIEENLSVNHQIVPLHFLSRCLFSK